MQFLYRDGTDYVFMDTRSYDQLQVETGLLGDAAKYLKEGDDAVLEFFGDEIVGVELPAAVELTIAETEPGLQGDRVSGARKPATLETGLVIQVPAVREPRREGQGRHPHGRVPHPGLSPTRRPDGPRHRPTWNPTMAADLAPRHQSRERALTLLYEADLKGEAPGNVLAALPVAPDRYVTTLVTAVGNTSTGSTSWSARPPSGWDIDRMAVVDRNVLRLATAELLACEEVPTAVVINEAVDLASAFSTDDSGRFVNGVLATVATRVRPGPAGVGH